VDVKIFDNDGGLTAQFENGQPLEVGSHIVALLGANGEMIIYLPADMRYTIEIIATGEGSVDFKHMVFCFVGTEYSEYESWQRELAAGDAITAEISQRI